ncbi:MAG TPA: carbohydrate-binding family 9-like protein [Pyrinomonadaceae bacterium]
MTIPNPIITAHHSEISLGVNELYHPEWMRAQAISITRKWSGEEAPISRHAEARIIWSEQSLVVRFVCRQQEALLVSANPQLDKKTIGLWERDVCEIFLAPDPNAPEHYFEFEAAPTGEWLDLRIRLTPEGRETDWEFDSGMTVATFVEKDQITIAMRIPWSAAISRPQRGDNWRVNLFRCIGKGNERYLAWQPTRTPEPYFHVPKVFGWLVFL